MDKGEQLISKFVNLEQRVQDMLMQREYEGHVEDEVYTHLITPFHLFFYCSSSSSSPLRLLLSRSRSTSLFYLSVLMVSVLLA